MISSATVILALAACALTSPLPQGLTISDSKSQQPAELCGRMQNIVLTDTPWIIYNMMYNQHLTVGTQCTNYERVSTGANGNKQIEWSSVTNIAHVKET